MRPPLALVVWLALLAPAAYAGPAPVAPDVQADWHRDGVDDRVKQALTGQGWRLEDDGRALDPNTKAPVTKAVLEKKILDLHQDARRAALEATNLLLSSGKPLEKEDLDKIQAMSADLPPGLVAAISDPKSDLNKVKVMADGELAQVSAYFDGGRTLADRQAAAQPVTAGAPGPRVDLPYFTATETSVGNKLRASAETVIGADPYGKNVVLARLDDKNKKLDLPPIVIEDQNGPVVAQYDIRRQAIVLDSEGVRDSIVGTVAPQRRIALRQSISTRATLLAYLDAHPEAVTAVMKDNDVVVAHELTHAWQDRRDPIDREMVRGNLPDMQPLEYEEEAWKTKNAYLQSKLKNDPASVKMDGELADFVIMNHGAEPWKQALFDNLETRSPARAMTIQSARAIETARLDHTRSRSVVTSADQQAKALDLQALTRAQRELADLDAAHGQRMTALETDPSATKMENYKLLGSYYLVQALNAQRSTDRSAWLAQAERYAVASGNKVLLAEVRKAKDSQ